MFSQEVTAKIREQSNQMDQTGVISHQILDFIYEQKLFKLFVPEELGGRMTPLPEALRLFADASKVDGNLGWTVTIGSGGGFFSALIDLSVCTNLFSNPKAVIAGSGTPSGVAKRVNGGYQVSGQWRYCSGAPHATFFTANCLIELADKPKQQSIRSFIFLPDQVKIIEDWSAFGLKATGSHSIQVEDIFVPDSMTFDLTEPNSYYNHPVFQYPFIPFAAASFAAVSIGIGKHFFEEAQLILNECKNKWETDRWEFVNQKKKQLEQVFTRSVEDFYKIIDTSWDKHIQLPPLSEEELDQISYQCKETARVALSSTDSLLPYLGMGAVMEHTSINRIWRDLHTACQHVVLTPFYEVEK
ncbi:acyl-CoA dehydrogenase [Hazenella coriacea]|uniref:Alkylation response protein AidB-like acyl-CoA dehydrogenase n=1 Tax=Hazenella coriacea TaxID=1179467 RepID=A0A4R3LBJ3_9BACL|nr:acyl-CoA dehydrogenase [Hazenella coriacea]TCS96590.1 alkylation response protein AidB-like acyl-CoA dehydrogenase [Hazenella coriacea]